MHRLTLLCHCALGMDAQGTYLTQAWSLKRVPGAQVQLLCSEFHMTLEVWWSCVNLYSLIVYEWMEQTLCTGPKGDCYQSIFLESCFKPQQCSASA